MAKNKSRKGAGPKPDPERAEALKSLPINIRQSLTEEEVEMFLHSEVWPDTLFEKLKDFIVKPD